MKIKLIAFGIAKDILGKGNLEMELEEPLTIGGLKVILVGQFPTFSELKSLRFAVNENYQPDDFLLKPADEVVIIPPVSGG